MSEILGNIYIWMFLVNSERLEVENLLWHKISQNLLFVYLFCPKTAQLILENFHNSGKVGRRKLPDHSLNCIFNSLSISVQYNLSVK